jgi:CubicO group peptidase (beta-lactamase class C family)
VPVEPVPPDPPVLPDPPTDADDDPPGDQWRTDPAADHGVDLDQLRRLGGDVKLATLIVQDREIFTAGNPDEAYPGWASSSRGIDTVAFLHAVQLGLIARDALDTPIRSTWPHLAVCQLFEADVTLAHLLSYTSGAVPAGSRWTYSGGGDANGDRDKHLHKHWPRHPLVFEAITGIRLDQFVTDHVLAQIGHRGQAKLNLPVDATRDGTLRVSGSVRDMARIGRLMLTGGRWGRQRLLDADLVARATGGGPAGDGHPYPLEGWQWHLCRNERMCDGSRQGEGEIALPGVPDCFAARDGSDTLTSGHGAIIVVPSRQAICAYRGAAIQIVLPKIMRAWAV